MVPSDYEFSDEENAEQKEGPDTAGVPVGGEVALYKIVQSKSEPEVSRDRCRSPRRSANSIIWKAVPTTIQEALSACGAEDWRIGMSASEMQNLFNHEDKLNQMMYPRSVLTSVSSCRKIKGKTS